MPCGKALNSMYCTSNCPAKTILNQTPTTSREKGAGGPNAGKTNFGNNERECFLTLSQRNRKTIPEVVGRLPQSKLAENKKRRVF
jgi:hypothetical protein